MIYAKCNKHNTFIKLFEVTDISEVCVTLTPQIKGVTPKLYTVWVVS